MAGCGLKNAEDVSPDEGDGVAEDLLERGLQYCLGREVPKDYVLAHKWFNLAAMWGCPQAREYRSEISREMSQSEVAEAQKQARLWIAAH